MKLSYQLKVLMQDFTFSKQYCWRFSSCLKWQHAGCAGSYTANNTVSQLRRTKASESDKILLYRWVSLKCVCNLRRFSLFPSSGNDICYFLVIRAEMVSENMTFIPNWRGCHPKRFYNSWYVHQPIYDMFLLFCILFVCV